MSGADAETTGASGLLRAGAVTAAGTVLSRVTGLARVAAQVWAIGYTGLSDAYALANTLPNVLFELVLGGVFSATLVPLFVRARGDRQTLRAVTSVAMTTLVAVAALVALAAPLFVRLVTASADDPAASDQRHVATLLLRLFALQIVAYGFTSLATAALNARRRFAAAAFAPVLNNLVVIAAFLLAPRVGDVDLTPVDGTGLLARVREDPAPLLVLGLGTTAGVVAMALVLVPGARALGLSLGRPDWRHPAVRQMLRLSGWTLGYVAANQVALLIVLALANGRDDGAVTAYQNAFVFFQLPHGVIAVSLLTAFTPELSAIAAEGDLRRFRRRYAEGLRVLALAVGPAAAGYLVLGKPLVGAFNGLLGASGGDGSRTGGILVAFAIGLFPFSAYLYTLRAFYARQDTRTPFLVNVVQNGTNVVLAFLLVGRLDVEGLGVAFALSYTLAAVLAFVLLARRLGGISYDATIPPIARITAACGAMALVVWAVSSRVGGIDGGAGVVRSGVGILVGVGAYVGALAALRVPDAARLRDLVLARAGRPPGDAPRPGAATQLP